MFDDTPFGLPVPLGAELAMHVPHHWSRPSCPACPICPLPHLPLPTAAPGAYASEVKYEPRHDRETYKKEEGYTHEDKKEYAPKEYSGEYDKYDYNYKSRDKPPKEYKEDYGPPPYNPKAYENYEYDRCAGWVVVVLQLVVRARTPQELLALRRHTAAALCLSCEVHAPMHRPLRCIGMHTPVGSWPTQLCRTCNHSCH